MSDSFFIIGAEARLGENNLLIKLNKLIDWNRIGLKLKGIHKNEVNPKGGPTAYDPLKMFKAILLGQWYNLSDPALEESLKIRVDFMLFTGFEISGKLPDETTFCRFRNKLIELKLIDKLLSIINLNLEELGIKVKNCDGAIIDATLIESQARPRKTVEIMPQDRNELETQADSKDCELNYSADPDAKWLKKGKKCTLGYKGFVRTDKTGFIEKTHTKPANAPEVKELKYLVSDVDQKNRRIYTDKGYVSEENRIMLKDKGLKDAIMDKATRGKPLIPRQKARNKLISRYRYKVEQCFGTLKRKFYLGRARYIGLEKVCAELCFKSICFNLNKALRMLDFV